MIALPPSDDGGSAFACTVELKPEEEFDEPI
jgi:hypothetical protein